MHELKKSIENGKVFFGVRQSLKNAKNLKKIIIPSNCRDEVLNLIKKEGIEIEEKEFTRQDISMKLELDFECEVFGIQK